MPLLSSVAWAPFKSIKLNKSAELRERHQKSCFRVAFYKLLEPAIIKVLIHLQISIGFQIVELSYRYPVFFKATKSFIFALKDRSQTIFLGRITQF